jgi:hypothetical protein
MKEAPVASARRSAARRGWCRRSRRNTNGAPPGARRADSALEVEASQSKRESCQTK